MAKRFRSYTYPWRDGHELDLLVDGEAFFPAMLDAIDSAERSILLCIYQVAPGGCTDRWCERLAAAAGRNVDVRVMVDAFGGFPAYAALKALGESGVRLRWFNPASARGPARNLFRDHRKLLVVDAATGFIGGFCLTDGFDPEHTDTPWHDMAMRVRGPCIADMIGEFEKDWVFHGGQPTGLKAAATQAGSSRCRLVRNHPLGMREIRRSVHRRIRDATRRVWVVTPYFAPSRRLRRLLRRAAQRGLDVRLLLSGPQTDHELVRSAGQRHYGRLLRAGARIFEYPGRCLHMKTVVVDDFVSGGSCNFDHWGLRWNRDANLEVDGGPLLHRFEKLLLADFDKSPEITLTKHRGRSLFSRLREWIGGLIDTQLLRLVYRRQLKVIKEHPARSRDA